MSEGRSQSTGWKRLRGWTHSFGACAVMCVAVSFFLAQAAMASTASRREAAAAAYQRAGRLRVALETHPNRSVEDYLRVVQAFELVYRTDPGYPKTPSALAAAAEVYQEMGRHFTSDRYDSKAIETYQFLAAQYPGGSLAIQSLDAAAGIYRNDLENPVAARAEYEKFLKIYPQSERAPDARQEIARIDAELARWPSGEEAARRRNPHPSTAARAAVRAVSRSDQESILAGNPPSGPASEPVTLGNGAIEEVESVRDWVGPSYTRVVIRTGGPVTFNAMRLERPPRLVFDLTGARVSPSLARKVFPVENGFLERVRVAQFSPTVTRVVLDVPQVEDYSVFALPNPFRLVIDIHGASKAFIARKAKPAATSPYGASGNPPADSLAAGQTGPLSDAPLAAAPDSEAVSTGADTPGAMPGAKRTRRHAVTENDSDSAAAGAALPDGVAGPQGALLGGSPTLTRALGLKIRRIVIDPGHGGHDTGTIGPSGVEEKNVVLDVALRLRKLIERRMGCQVIMTRSTDTFIPLEERTAIANEYGADLFVSIHANASHDPSARGVEVYYLNFTSDPEALQIAARENATSQESVYQLQSLIKKIALSEKIDESRQFAQIVDTRLIHGLDEDGDTQKNRGVKKAPFVVLIGANMPSILAEISFLSNPHDERLLRKPSFREQIAQGLYGGILRYANSLGTLHVAEGAPLEPAGRRTPSF
ncbi:MAG: N-acetylmuramoyl-L-alanine amidase [Terriglobia bacterium]